MPGTLEGNDLMKTTLFGLLTAFALTIAPGCGDDGGGGGGGADGGGLVGVDTYTVSGAVLDFETQTPIDGAATVVVQGITPTPGVVVQGADFTISDILPFSVFDVLAGSPPDYRNTYNVGIVVEGANRTGVDLSTAKETYVTGLATAFGVTPMAGTSIVIARAVDDAGQPRAGIPAAAFALAGATFSGPYFLDANRAAAPAATETSASGYVVFFDVAAGTAAITAADNSGYTMAMGPAPVAATTLTLAEVIVTDGAPVLPTNVSFANDVVPIFSLRGCDRCHSGNGIGRDLGNLTLDGSVNLMYREVTEEISPIHNKIRVNVMAPAESLLLTMPTAETPPDTHPNVTFLGMGDPDYRIIFAWISEGAKDN